MTVPTRRIVVRVLDAVQFETNGAVHVVVSGDLPLEQIAEEIANGGARADVRAGRLDAFAVPDRLANAAGRVGGRELAEPFGVALDAAVAAWSRAPRDLSTPAGTLSLSSRPVVMGILNVTPDSFSDGGRFDVAEAAIAHGRAMVGEGADLVDVGGESTRPGASAVSLEEELARVLPVVEALAGDGVIVSIDTTKAEVAKQAVARGASIVNDVSAGESDPAMLDVVAGLAVPYVAMHAQGTPRTMQDDPRYDDVVAEVFEYLAARRDRCLAAGIAADRVVVDPGIGFGKTAAHNLTLLAAIRQFASLGCPTLVGASRKSFLGAVTGVDAPSARLAGSLAAAVLAVHEGASIVRVHDVRATVEALRVASSVRVGEPVAWERPGTPAASDHKDSS